MDILAWLWWVASTLVTGMLSLIWFLISGWVSTLLQIAVLVIVIYFLKYGWQRAPAEIWKRTRTFADFFVRWIRAREEDVTRVKEAGLVISTYTSLDQGQTLFNSVGASRASA